MNHRDTLCHLGRPEGVMGETCPQGANFAVKNLIHNSGHSICPKSSCPYQVAHTGQKVVQALGNTGHMIVIERR